MLLLTLPALAEYDPFSYNGPLDSFSGLPQGYTDDAAEESSGSNTLVNVSSDVYYDTKAALYQYMVNSTGGAIRCSVMDGMVTTGSVEIYLPQSVEAELYLDGDPVEGDISEVSEPGSYTLNRISSGNRDRVLSFTIVNSVTGTLNSYRLPTGFCVDSVVLDNVEQTADPYSVDLYEEGSYKISYHCMKTNVAYSLRLQIDRTPPTLALEAVTDGVANGPVDISDLERGASIRITLDGQDISASETLTQSGQYRISVFDDAGNRSEYSFRIKVYFNMNSIAFLGLIAAIAVGVVLFMKRTRKKMRVR